MEKLNMLIDIYEEEVVGVHSVGEKITEKEEARIISKKFGFIERLVENKKIKEDEYQYIGTDDEQYTYSKYENLLMKLSRIDNPIEFLVSILK